MPILGGQPQQNYSQRKPQGVIDSLLASLLGQVNKLGNLPNPKNMSTQDYVNMVDNVGGMGAIRAFHGSPHKITKFKDEAFGTGEGAQGVGLGHYSGENLEALDAWYRDNLLKAEYGMVNDYVKTPIGKRQAAKWMKHNDMGMKEYKSELIEERANQLHSPLSLPKGENKDFLSYGRDIPPNKGYMYELEWKPGQKDILHFDKNIDKHLQKMQSMVDNFYTDNPEYVRQQTMHSAYRHMQDKMGDLGVKNFLSKQDIPGHSFPGQGGAKGGLPNYVMYNPEDIKIMKRVRGGLDSTSPRAKQHLRNFKTGQVD